MLNRCDFNIVVLRARSFSFFLSRGETRAVRSTTLVVALVNPWTTVGLFPSHHSRAFPWLLRSSVPTGGRVDREGGGERRPRGTRGTGLREGAESIEPSNRRKSTSRTWHRALLLGPRCRGLTLTCRPAVTPRRPRWHLDTRNVPFRCLFNGRPRSRVRDFKVFKAKRLNRDLSSFYVRHASIFGTDSLPIVENSICIRWRKKPRFAIFLLQFSSL